MRENDWLMGLPVPGINAKTRTEAEKIEIVKRCIAQGVKVGSEEWRMWHKRFSFISVKESLEIANALEQTEI